MARGFKDSSGKFHPTGKNGTSSREKSTKPQGMNFDKRFSGKITSELALPKEMDLKILNNDMRDIADDIDQGIYHNTKGSIPSEGKIIVIKDKLLEIEEADEKGFIRGVSFNPVPELKDLGVDVTEEDHKQLVHVGKLIEEISEDTEPISENAKDTGRFIETLIDERRSLGELLGNVGNQMVELQNDFSASFEEHDVDVVPDLNEMFGILSSITLISENLNANGSELHDNVVRLSQQYKARTKQDIETNVDQIAESFQTLLSKSDKLSFIANRLFDKIEENFDRETFEKKIDARIARGEI